MAVLDKTHVSLTGPELIATPPPLILNAPARALPYIETPLVKSVVLSQQFGANVWLKFEQAQLSGSFKSRGIGWLIYRTIEDNPGIDYHFFCASAGNAGYAAACAAQQYQQKCTVCLPENSDPLMVSRIEQTGARVIPFGKNVAASDKYVNSVLLSQSRANGETPFYCHPFDLELVWEGNSSIADEIVVQTARAGFTPDAVVCSIGGGGLYNGIIQGLQRHNMCEVEVVAVQTDGCSTLRESLTAKSQVVSDPNTVCSSLATSFVSLQTLEYALNNVQPTHSVVVSERDAVQACVSFAETHKMLVEPACGAALAPLYTGTMPPHLKRPDTNIVVVVCGGSNITYRKLDGLCQRFGVEFIC